MRWHYDEFGNRVQEWIYDNINHPELIAARERIAKGEECYKPTGRPRKPKVSRASHVFEASKDSPGAES